ncbi:hypothetical protein ACFXI0_23910 [Kitasatospora indigofera]|uniref:hypothetical protein n=1 Tax=Kitasatospora indigofera TaxID=67307 RepID=UPI0036C4372D
MKKTSWVRAVGTAAVSAAVAATCLITAGPASAATSNQFTLCSDGWYSSYAVFPYRHMSTKVVAPGTCTTLYFGGDGTEYVELYVAGSGLGIGGFSYERGAGTGVSTTGNASSPGYYRW